jgi:murein DD-endopeptidase MepM/ murein hydrolase activator NlpD
VSFSGWSGGFGNFIMIRHGSLGGDIYYTAYAHQSANLVSVGQNVVQGQVIGLVGSTGWSTGPHIHFEIIRNGVRVNPMLYFQ